jgi:hypothetical protein
VAALNALIVLEASPDTIPSHAKSIHLKHHLSDHVIPLGWDAHVGVDLAIWARAAFLRCCARREPPARRTFDVIDAAILVKPDMEPVKERNIHQPGTLAAIPVMC